MNVTLKDGRVLTLPDAHVMIEGTPNSGKSNFAASAELPMIVIACDPISKMMPYFNRGVVDREIYTGPQGQPMWLVRSRKTGNAIIQVEGYYDEDDANPVAMDRLLARMPQITEEAKVGRVRTVVIDSWTQLEWIAKIRRTNGAFSNVDSVYGAAKDDLQNMVNSRLMNLRCNLIITFHIETKVIKDRKGNVTKDSKIDLGGGELSYSVQAIGTLKNIGNVLGESYLAVAPVDGSENYLMQTRRDANFRNLCSRLQAPNPCPNTWNAIFGPWIEREAALSSPPNTAAEAASTDAAAAAPKEE